MLLLLLRRLVRAVSFWVVVVGLLVFTSGVAQASSYLDIFGTVHDPILTTTGATHSYSGTNLSPGANLAFAVLDFAELAFADLDHTTMDYAELEHADLSNSDMHFVTLRYADLSNSDFTSSNLHYATFGSSIAGATLTGANFSGANLSNAQYLGLTTGSAYYDALTNFTLASTGGNEDPLFDPVAAGWTFVPRTLHRTPLRHWTGRAGDATKATNAPEGVLRCPNDCISGFWRCCWDGAQSYRRPR